MMHLFDTLAGRCSRLTTHMYSTSFSLGIRCLHKNLRSPIHAIYGFVRFADEIVDTFNDYNKRELLFRFREETYRSIEEKISLNPILHSFQSTVNEYKIDRRLVELFLHSMEMDLEKKEYQEEEIKEYIAGSAEVVGLMCLSVFCKHNANLYALLSPYARRLGSAFQKINFLRDLNTDYNEMGRTYFPGIKMSQWSQYHKAKIEKSIQADFTEALKGIKQLPRSSRFGVYVAYIYYLSLFKKIQNTPPDLVMKRRIRITNQDKARLLAYSYVKHQLNMI
ncbi:MAG TPA: phytoene/squalene synthase family protein [Chryseolinea sp.]|nr:phytoene/squalene synthase family protein [Chryseolinea sp.]